MIIRFHRFFPPISSCYHSISSAFPTYFFILSVWVHWIDQFSPAYLFISTCLFYHSLSSVFPTCVFIYHLIPFVFPTYFLMLPWVLFSISRPVYSFCPSFSSVFPAWSFIGIIRFHPCSQPMSFDHEMLYNFPNHFCILSFSIIDFPPYFFVLFIRCHE